MKIYLDVSAAVHRRAGLGRYAESLARAMFQLAPDELALFYNREGGITPLKGLESFPTSTISLGYKPWRMVVWMGQLAQAPFNRLVPEAALFHATEHLLMPLRGIPTVLTVHDLIFRHFPAYHKRLNRWYLNLTMPLFCRRASRIVAISECTKRDLVSAYGVPREKISVVYEAADPAFKPQPAGAVASACARYGLPDRYLLFVGTIEPRKNLGRLLQAFEALKADGLTDGLVIVGRFGWLYQRFLAQLETSPARDAVLFPGYVPDDDLPAVYTGAQAVVFPSLYEGFGLPVLEAMACGTPVVASRAASIPEIGAEAASYFDPSSVGSITDAVSHVLKDPNLQAEMRQAGFARAAQFSWDRVATETRQVYSALLEDGSILGGHGAP